VVVINAGRYAGKKAMIVTNYNDGTKSKRFGHCLVFGIERYPRKISKKMTEEKIKRRITVKPFVKYVNYNHFIFTRYFVKFDNALANLVSEFNNKAKEAENSKGFQDPFQNKDFKKEYKKKLRSIMEKHYQHLTLNKDVEKPEERRVQIPLQFLFTPLKF
jgi:large subunit ribosomal protein L27e